MGLEFWKMTGAGNDFVVMDNRTGHLPPDGAERAALIQTLCARRIGVGADGALLVEPSERADFRMRYYNSDGSEAETCGNGARCIARFAHMIGAAEAEMCFETMAGLYGAEVMEETVRVSMGDAFDLRMGVIIDIPDLFDDNVDFLNSGVPHAIVRVNDIENVPVVKLGRALRHHEEFAPAGTNINFVTTTDEEDKFIIRTYERGVEDETLACGTGCIAAAVVMCRRLEMQGPVRMVTRSGQILTIGFQKTDLGAEFITLEGEARVVYRAELP